MGWGGGEQKQPVWEITGAEFTNQGVHTADGISIRFPRVTRIRRDKDWSTATTLNELRSLFEKKPESVDFGLLLGASAEGGSNIATDVSPKSFAKKGLKRKETSPLDEASTSFKVKEEPDVPRVKREVPLDGQAIKMESRSPKKRKSDEHGESFAKGVEELPSKRPKVMKREIKRQTEDDDPPSARIKKKEESGTRINIKPRDYVDKLDVNSGGGYIESSMDLDSDINDDVSNDALSLQLR